MRIFCIILITIMLTALTGCFSFTSFQTAKLLEPGGHRTIISYAHNEFIEDDQEDGGWNLVEIHPRWGLMKILEVGGKISFLYTSDNENTGYLGFVLGLDGKVSVIPDYLAVNLGGTFLVGEFAFQTFQLHPGVIGSLRLSQEVEFFGAARKYFFLHGDDPGVYSFNLGLGLSRDLDRYAFRPEVGWLIIGDQAYFQIGLGLDFPVRPESEE